MQAEIAQYQRTGTRKIYQSAQSGGNPLCAGDALFYFPALLVIARALQFQFQMREDAEQRIVDPVGRTQRQLCQCRVLFILSKLRLELELLLIQFAVFIEDRKSTRLN